MDFPDEIRRRTEMENVLTRLCEKLSWTRRVKGVEIVGGGGGGVGMKLYIDGGLLENFLVNILNK